MSTITVLQATRDALAAIDGVRSARIGIEANISPDDYPIVRLVPETLVPGRPYTTRTATCWIYFGMPIADAEGLEHVYAELFRLEDAILDVLKTLGARYRQTVMDSDRLPTYKVAAIQVDLSG